MPLAFLNYSADGRALMIAKIQAQKERIEENEARNSAFRNLIRAKFPKIEKNNFGR